MSCARCGGFWADDGWDARCLNCGHRAVGLIARPAADALLEEVIKTRMSRPVGSKNKPKSITVAPLAQIGASAARQTAQVSTPKPQASKVFNPFKFFSEDHMDEEPEIAEAPTTSPDRLRALDETNPFLQVLAEEWEALDEQILGLKARQDYLRDLVQKCRARMEL